MSWWDDAIGTVGNGFAAVTGSLGAVAGGATSFVTGHGFQGVGEGWNAGASFSPVGSWGGAARATVRDTNDRLLAGGPTWLQWTSTGLGPPTSAAQAFGDLALSAVPALRGAKAAAPAGRASMGFLDFFVRTGERAGTETVERGAQRSLTTAGKVTLAAGVGAYSYDVFQSFQSNDHGTGGNPFVPNLLESFANTTGDAANQAVKSAGTLAKWAPVIVVGVGVVLAIAFVKGAGART